MNVKKFGDWVCYSSDKEKNFEKDKSGKWMYFFEDIDFVSKICAEAIERDIVLLCKHNNCVKGVSCFYLNCDDIKTHKMVIQYFIEKNLIQRTKKGLYYNISFKLNSQTRNNEYGENFKSNIKLDKFIDLYTGKWII